MNEFSAPVVQVQMLIRKPVSEVFQAFIDPEVTTRFWFSHSSGPVEKGSRLRWDWMMFGVFTYVDVNEIEANRRIVIEWDDPACPVEWLFENRGSEGTLVKIAASGFQGDHNQVMAQALDAKGGFTTVLAACKAWLEHGIDLGLVHDQFPDAIVKPEP